MEIKSTATKQEIGFMAGLVGEFKGYVVDCMAEGMHEGFDDHLDFLRTALENFIEATIQDREDV